MMRNKTLATLFVLLIAVALVGCSGADTAVDEADTAADGQTSDEAVIEQEVDQVLVDDSGDDVEIGSII